MIVIRRMTDGKYVAKPGSKNAYTRNLQNARQYATYEAAAKDCCGDESVAFY